MKRFVTILIVLLAVAECFGQLDLDRRVYAKTYGTVSEGHSTWGEFLVVDHGFANFYVYVNPCHHCHDYDINITLVDKNPHWDEWKLVQTTSKPDDEVIKVRFVDCREAADFVIRIENPERIPEWLKDSVAVRPRL